MTISASDLVVENADLSRLRPDHENPRFPAGIDGAVDSDEDIFRLLAERFDAFRVAESILRHGYFPSEPMIVMPGDGLDLIVLEGNRRLTALRGLESKALRDSFADSRWRSIEQVDSLPSEIPVVVVPDRKSVAPLLGYRHITGIQEWEPFAQARFIAQLVDEGDLDFDAVEKLIGRSLTEVRSFYRNYSIVEQANDWGIEDVERITDEFGVWNRAMQSQNIRSYIGAPAPSDVVAGEYPLDPAKELELSELLTWIYGRPRTEEERENGSKPLEGKAISESRELNRLGKVLVDASGVSALKRGSDLVSAERSMGSELDRLRDALLDAYDALVRASAEKPTEVDAEISELLSTCRKLVADIESSLDDHADA